MMNTSDPVVGQAMAAELTPEDIHAENEDEQQVKRQLRPLPGF